MSDWVLAYGNERIPYEVRFKAGRSGKVAIHVEHDGSVVVDTPEGTDAQRIREAVSKRAGWIYWNVQEARERFTHVLPRSYVSGEQVHYLGRRHVLKVIPVAKPDRSVRLYRGTMEVRTENTDSQAIRGRLRGWYKVRAQAYLKTRLNAVSEALPWIETNPPFHLIETDKRWGSCSTDGTVRLNPFLIKAPRECIDYVVLHELVHHAEHNHSPRFYSLLDRHMPRWQEYKRRLDAMAEVLLNE
ncbi:M48 family metallopeptidase [Roseibium sp.]|uniref:M48 family metallopeptidase n=1 Tax=Roseibium sp. TaxID=1936156 RepID=UPI002624DE98|nr:SprT family zinc-dependent metalloprotease [Roseibium sp.]